MDISVIIPVYNKAAYLGKCLENVLSQQYDSFEVMAVDDGSTDGSGDICDQWAKKDQRLRVIHQMNAGVTTARRRGVEESAGEYVMFVDADDGLLPHAMQHLYDAIVKSGADEVIARFRTHHGLLSPMVYPDYADPRTLIRCIITGKNRFPVLWSILFRRSLLADVLDTPRDIIEGEDKLMQVKILMKHPKVFFVSEPAYLYTLGLPNSRHHTLERERLYDQLLRQTLEPQWQEYRTAYVLHQLKEYERFIHDGQDEVRHLYYQQAIGSLPADIPLYDRMVYLLPPMLARPVIKLYRKLITLKQKGL